jgi:hypothetical protein
MQLGACLNRCGTAVKLNPAPEGRLVHHAAAHTCAATAIVARSGHAADVVTGIVRIRCAASVAGLHPGRKREGS